MSTDRPRSHPERRRNLGSAKTGVGHWWAQRVTAVGLIPLTLWLVGSLIAHVGSDHESFVEWLGSPLAAVLMILLLIALLHHMALGLQVVIEDYVHAAGAKVLAVLAVQLGCSLLAVLGVVSVLRIALSG